MIITGELKPGERIVERTLCAALDVSRTPLREALKLLEIDGLVELSQNRGGTVRPFTRTEARELFELLGMLESEGVALAATRMDTAALDAIAALHAEMEDAFAAGDLGHYFEINTAIHDALMAATGNAVLHATYRTLMLRAKRGRFMAILNPGRWREAMTEHRALMEALAARDADAARAVWRVHLSHTGTNVVDSLERHRR